MTQVIVALDMDSIKKQKALLKALHGMVHWYKIGLQLFTAEGRRAVELVLRHGGKVFLDLKIHDIPQTAANAVRAAQKLGVDALSLHLMGGADMLRAAVEISPRPMLWGVTVLTSMGPEDVGIFSPAAKIPSLVKSLAKQGRLGGADAIICSPREVALLRKHIPQLDMKFVTPGIRPTGAALDDQRRVMTPGEAARLGIDYVVIGRPITHSCDPRQAALDILAEIRTAVKKS